MRRTAIAADGSLQLGEAARCIGFAPGAVVDVIVTRSGSLILALADDAQVLDLPAVRLPAGQERRALVDGARRR